MKNLLLADKRARRGKKNQKGIKVFDKNREGKLLMLQDALKSKTFKTSEYTTFKIFETKERDIFSLPYYPDRIVHHAIMNVLEPVFMAIFTADTYSCIKGRGIHGAAYYVKESLRNKSGTEYCLKLDIKKFYPSINHVILKELLRRKFKDKDLLWLLDEIIDSADGLPIGNYLSQYFANFYLTYFDHWLKEAKGVTYYFRYADDIVILAPNKEYLHDLLNEIKQYLKINLDLIVKENYQVFPVKDRGIDFVGYVFFHTHIRLRKSIKKNFARMLAKRRNYKSIASYNGWLTHGNCINLKRTLLNEGEDICGVRNRNTGRQKTYRRFHKNRSFAK